jgi:hypothetical protein
MSAIVEQNIPTFDVEECKDIGTEGGEYSCHNKWHPHPHANGEPTMQKGL